MDNLISIQSIGAIIRRRMAPIAAFTFLVAVAAFIYFFMFAPKRYNSMASVLFSSKPSVGSMFNVESLGAFMSDTMMQGSDLNFKAILDSRRLQDSVFKRPDILARYQKNPRFKGYSPQDIVDQEKEFLSVIVDNKILFISFLGPTREIAADVVNAYTDELIAFVNEQRHELNHNQRDFLEKELANSRDKLDELEDIIRDYEEKNPELLNPESDRELVRRYSSLNMQKEQILIELSSMETENSAGNNVYDWAEAANQLNDAMQSDPTITYLRQQLAQYNLELATKSQVLGDTHPTIVKLREQIVQARSEIENEIRKQYKGKQEYLDSIHNVLNDYDADIKAFPGIKMQYARMYRDKEILTKVYEMMRTEYEKLRIEEERKDYSLSVLDRGVRPRKKASPQTVKNTLIIALAGFFVISYMFILIETRRAVRAARPENGLDIAS